MCNGAMSRQTQFVKNLQRFRLVTFDVTDTILKFKKPPAEHYAVIAHNAGITDIDKNKIGACFRTKFKAMTKEHPNFGYETPNMSWQKWWTDFSQSVFHCASPSASPDVIRTVCEELVRQYRTDECWDHVESNQLFIEKLRHSKKYVGVISNFDPGLHNLLHSMNLHHLFDLVLCSYEAGVQKPNTKIFNILLEHFRLRPEEALHIGNIYDIDYIGARNAGWSSLLISNDDIEDKYVQRNHVFPSLTVILQVLETKNIQW